jgi:glycosyltransferase involved in cell wall biosynthesis
MNSTSEVAETERSGVLEGALPTSPARLEVGSPFKVLLHGLEYFCRGLPAAFQSDGWEIRHHSVHQLRSFVPLVRDLRAADLLFLWGSRISFGKFLRVARFFDKRNVVMFWAGSDVLGAQMQFAQGICEPWIAAKTHWAGAPWLRDEIQALGMKCEFVPITWVPRVERPHPLPERFSILVYLPDVDRAPLYGLERILQVARSLPHISFELVGLASGRVLDPPPNLRIRGRIADIAEVYRRSSVYWRPVSHDGLSFMSLEAMSHGRHVIWSYPFPHCKQSTNVKTDRAEILRLHDQHERKLLSLNESAVEMVAERFSLDAIRNDYLRRWEQIILSSAERR